MTNVTHLSRVVSGPQVDGEAIAFGTGAEVRNFLHRTRAFDDPTTGARVVVAIARMLLDPGLTEQTARARGWASLEAAHRRGLDLLDIVVS